MTNNIYDRNVLFLQLLEYKDKLDSMEIPILVYSIEKYQTI